MYSKDIAYCDYNISLLSTNTNTHYDVNKELPNTQLAHQEIVKNYLAELHIRDGVNEAIISNLQSSLYPRVLQGYRKDKRDLQTMD